MTCLKEIHDELNPSNSLNASELLTAHLTLAPELGEEVSGG